MFSKQSKQQPYINVMALFYFNQLRQQLSSVANLDNSIPKSYHYCFMIHAVILLAVIDKV